MIRSNLIKYIEHTPDNFNLSIFNGLLDSYLSNINYFYKEANLTKIEDYFYSLKCDNIDYDAGAEYCGRFFPRLGGCSSVYKNGIYGRNYDWYYDNTVSFFVITSATNSRHASFGVASVSLIDKNLVEKNIWTDLYSIVPNMMLDGMNDAGVVCNINVAPSGDYGFTVGTNPNKESMCVLMLVRYILDNADSVDHAISLLQEKNWWAPHSSRFDNELHFMIADSTKSCVVEFINNKIKIIEGAQAMTNFYLYDVEFNEDGSVYTPATQTETENAIITNNITPYGSGLERYNLINSTLNNIKNVDDMIDLMQSLYYSQAYTANPDDNSWYTEMVGNRGLTVISSPEEYQPVFEIAYDWYVNRDRNSKKTWQTVHSCVYDIENLSVSIFTQEGTIEHKFNLIQEDK